MTLIDLLAFIGAEIFIFAIYFTTLHFINKSNNDRHYKRHYYLSPFALELENKWFKHYLEQRYKCFFGGFLDDDSYLDEENKKNTAIENLEKENQQLKEKVSELEKKVQDIYSVIGDLGFINFSDEDFTKKLKQENEKLKTQIKTYKNKIKTLDNKKEIKKQRKTRGAC